MTHHDPSSPPAPQPTAQLSPGDAAELERLSHSVGVRLAPHVEAAAAAVRAAEQDLADAREQLERARAQAAAQPYRSDPLVFMRVSVQDEVEALGRKTTARKAKAAFRYLLDRATELAEGEVAGYHADRAAADRERLEGVEARVESERRAQAALEAAREMQDRVRMAEQRAHEGVALMAQKLAAEGEAS